jgi:ribosome-associated heat shock protein Hsp15
MLARQVVAEQRRLYREPSLELKSRPTKRDRRTLERLRGGG